MRPEGWEDSHTVRRKRETDGPRHDGLDRARDTQLSAPTVFILVN